MRLILTLAAGAALAACSQTTTGDNSAANADSAVEANADETVLPADDATGESDTLGNQLNQLNDSGTADENSTATDAE